MVWFVQLHPGLIVLHQYKKAGLVLCMTCLNRIVEVLELSTMAGYSRVMTLHAWIQVTLVESYLAGHINENGPG